MRNLEPRVKAPEMRSRLGAVLEFGVLFLVVTGGIVTAGQQAGASDTDVTAVDPAGGTGSYLLTATNTGPDYAPTFTGNGELGIRVPPQGQGYEGGAIPIGDGMSGIARVYVPDPKETALSE